MGNKGSCKAHPSGFAQFLLVLQLEAVHGFSQFSWSWTENLMKKREVRSCCWGSSSWMAKHQTAPHQLLVLTRPSSSRSLGCPAEPGCLWYRKAPFPSATLSCLHCKLSISVSENSHTASVSGILFPVEIIVTT